MQHKIQGEALGVHFFRWFWKMQVFNLKIPTIRKFCLFEGRCGGKFVVDHVGSKTEVFDVFFLEFGAVEWSSSKKNV